MTSRAPGKRSRCSGFLAMQEVYTKIPILRIVIFKYLKIGYSFRSRREITGLSFNVVANRQSALKK